MTTAVITPVEIDTADRPVWYATRLGQILLTITIFVTLVVIWDLYVRLLGLSSLVLPSPYQVWLSLVENTLSGRLIDHMWVTLSEVLLGFLLGSVVGIALGTLTAQSPLMRTILGPYILASQAMPKLALAPIIVICWPQMLRWANTVPTTSSAAITSTGIGTPKK